MSGARPSARRATDVRSADRGPETPVGTAVPRVSQTRLFCVVRVQPERAVLLTEIQVDASLTSAVLATKTVAMHLVPTYHEALAAILRHGQQ